MATKLLLTVRTPKDAEKICKIGCKVLAEYPDSILVRCTRAQREALRKACIETAELTEQSVQAIQRHEFPRFTNDQATAPIGAPADRVFGDVRVGGANQIVVVADPLNHPQFHGSLGGTP